METPKMTLITTLGKLGHHWEVPFFGSFKGSGIGTPTRRPLVRPHILQVLESSQWAVAAWMDILLGSDALKLWDSGVQEFAP